MGKVHIYCGDGKGKTTAAVGLAVRAKGAGRRVYFLQFLKDGSSSELLPLNELGIEVKSGMPEGLKGFTRKMDAYQLERLKRFQTANLREAMLWLREKSDQSTLVLDEAVASCNLQLLPERELRAFLEEVKRLPDTVDIALTGREPSAALMAMADYISEVKAVKHPFDQGLKARLGSEF